MYSAQQVRYGLLTFSVLGNTFQKPNGKKETGEQREDYLRMQLNFKITCFVCVLNPCTYMFTHHQSLFFFLQFRNGVSLWDAKLSVGCSFIP